MKFSADFFTGIFSFFGTVVNTLFTDTPVGWLVLAVLLGVLAIVVALSFLGGK